MSRLRYINGVKERHCPKCDTWRRFNSENWYIGKKGFATRSQCRPCINPSGRRRGMHFKSQAERQRNAVATAVARARLEDVKLNPNAVLDECKRLGLNPQRMAAWFDLELEQDSCCNLGGPVRLEEAA